MKLKHFLGLALAGSLGLAGCGPPVPPAYGGAELEVESEPPPPQVEVQPTRPHTDAVWIEGHWAWTGARYDWVPGHWVGPQQGWTWVPHHWVRAGRHWRFVPGHWRRI